MAILRTKSSRHQAWLDLPFPGPLPFGIRSAPAPLPTLPRYGTPECWAASRAVSEAAWRVECAEAEAEGQALIDSLVAAARAEKGRTA